MNSKVVKISDFQNLSGWVEKYKLALSKLDSSWDNSYCVRLVIVSLAVNIGKLPPFVSEDNLFCWVYLFIYISIYRVRYFRFFKDVEVNSRKLFRQNVFGYTKFF